MNEILHIGFLNIIFLILAIVSIAITIYYYFKSKRAKEPVYSKKTFKLVQTSLTNLKNIEIKYDNSVVKNLSLTQLAFWNTGQDPIRREDIAIKNPIIIKSLDSVIIYDFEIIQQNEVNNFNLEKLTENEIKITFDFINFNDGIIANIFHSGSESSQITLSGTFIGAKTISPIQSNVIVNKIDKIFEPWRHLIRNKSFALKCIGWILSPVVLAIGIPLFIVTIIFELVYHKFDNRYPKEFMLFDNTISGE